jgi:hypothetical protein
MRQGLVLLLWLAVVSNTFAGEPSPIVRDEVQHLLGYLGNSGCEFFRNGAWHRAEDASDHIARKYDYLLKKDLIKTSEDFIRGAATKSSVSGKAYQVRCKDNQPVSSAAWLSEELARYREGIRGTTE